MRLSQPSATAVHSVVGRYRIPFNRPFLTSAARSRLAESISSSVWSGDGPFTRRVRQLLEEELDVPAALLTTSGTSALEMMALLIDVATGDEVIVPSYTFASTANAFILRGVRPVFIDARVDTLNLDERLLPELITRRTRAIVTMHYAGVACEMDAIHDIVADRSITVLEDNAHGLFGQYRGRPLGTLGALAALSFHETKNFPCGEGGCLLVNDEQLLDRAEILREKGTDRSRFWRGEVNQYTWRDIGSSYLLADPLAAILLGQLEERELIQQTRMRAWKRYMQELQPWAVTHGVTLPTVPPHCEHPAHLFYLCLSDASTRSRLIAHLASQGILAVSHYVPLNTSPFGRRLGGRPGQCPVSEDISKRLVRLPLYNDISDDDIDSVLETVTSCPL
jgi:dTDP-4-amino-4,6-dideoxygalactose transaminase